MKDGRLRDIIDIAIVAAVYVAFTLALYPLSYGSPQFRLSEFLVLLTFFNKKHGIGVTIGVLIANFFNTEGFALIDCIFGTLSTAIAVILIAFTTKKLFVASLYPVLTSIIVVFEIWYAMDFAMSFWLIMLEVMGSMFIIESIIGYTVFKLLSKNKGFLKAIRCNREDLLNGDQSSGVNQ